MSEPKTAGEAPESVVVEETRGGGRYQVEVRAGGVSFLADEPVASGGLGSGPNPYDLLGAALGACTAMTLRLYADRKAWPLERVKVLVNHERSGLDARDQFIREIRLEGALDEAQRTRLLEIANRCPVHGTLERGADVRTTLIDFEPVPEPAETDIDQHMRDMCEACVDLGGS
ncbi:MAG: OsmC family protein [Phenylobacterium sp.]